MVQVLCLYIKCVSILVCNVVVKGVDHGVTEWVKQGTLKWSGHVTRMNEDDFLQSV